MYSQSCSHGWDGNTGLPCPECYPYAQFRNRVVKQNTPWARKSWRVPMLEYDEMLFSQTDVVCPYCAQLYKAWIGPNRNVVHSHHCHQSCAHDLIFEERVAKCRKCGWVGDGIRSYEEAIRKVRSMFQGSNNPVLENMVFYLETGFDPSPPQPKEVVVPETEEEFQKLEMEEMETE